MTATTLLSDNGASSGTSGYKLTGGNDGTLQLQTATSGGTATTAVTIDNSQNVGIGTSSPALPLHVASTGAYQARFERTSSANSYITFKGTSTVGNNGIGTSGDNVSLITGGTERAVIDSSGNVGIGTSSPSAKLNLYQSGSASAMALIYNNTNAAELKIQTNANDAAFTSYYTNGNRNWSIGPGQTVANLFEIRDLTAGATRMGIDSSGNLLFNSGYGSVATAYGCRAWVNFNGTGTVAITASANVTSITDNGTGDYTVVFTSAMPDGSYSIAGFCQSSGATSAAVPTGGTTFSAITTSCRFQTRTASGTADCTNVCVNFFR